jgi:hypothetical protein
MARASSSSRGLPNILPSTLTTVSAASTQAPADDSATSEPFASAASIVLREGGPDSAKASSSTELGLISNGMFNRAINSLLRGEAEARIILFTENLI